MLQAQRKVNGKARYVPYNENNWLHYRHSKMPVCKCSSCIEKKQELHFIDKRIHPSNVYSYHSPKLCVVKENKNSTS